ncbi:MAG: hypothetical protein RID09_09270 [Coleofasciculus sp. G1-WW12-02]|uniref:hypothetical protein n=1 Tax=Coleofasciculus sp. G1-WW12-02 TaxID=3068483 RepID=UPI0032F5BB6A
MKTSNQHSLWCSSNRQLYFLIPDNQHLPSGNFKIHQLAGIERQVDLKALAPYEISAKDAEPYMQQEVAQVINQVSSLFSNIVGITIQNSKHSSTNSEQTADSAQPASTLLANLLGVSVEEFINNPETAQEGLQSFVTEVATAMQKREVQNSDQTQVIKTSVDAVLETLQSRGLNIPELDTSQLIEDLAKDISELSEELKSNFSKSSYGVETAATQMQEAALQIDNSFSNLSQTLTQGLAKLQNLANKSEKKPG